MLCPECNISGGCYCHDEPLKVKHTPRDHEKELEKHLADLESEIAYKLRKEERRENIN